MRARNPGNPKMFSWVVAASVASALMIAGAVAEEATAGKPSAVFPSTLHDFGAVDRGEKLEHIFIVRNEGDAPLEILGAKPT